MAYKHGVYTNEQATSLVAPVVATAGLQVVIGTAPVNRASDPYHCTNVPMLANTLDGATAAVGYSDDYENYTLCKSIGASFKVVKVAPKVLINVLDPNKHKKKRSCCSGRGRCAAGQAGRQGGIRNADRWH